MMRPMVVSSSRGSSSAAAGPPASSLSVLSAAGRSVRTLMGARRSTAPRSKASLASSKEA